MKISQILEARYAGRYKTSDVSKQYNSMVKYEADNDPVGMLEGRVDGNTVYGFLYIYADDENELRRSVYRFMMENNAPFDDITDMEHIEDDWWNATVEYRGEA